MSEEAGQTNGQTNSQPNGSPNGSENASAAVDSVVRSGAKMAIGTVISRITGLGRDIAMVAAIGFATLSDTFSLGNSLPNIVYILVVGGALNAVFVPQLVRHLHDDEDRGDAYANALLTVVGAMLLLFTVVAIVCAPLLVDLYTTSNYDSRQLAVATAFAWLCLPQIFFYGVYTMVSQVLNSRGHFTAPMFAPILNNLVAMASIGLFLLIAGTESTVTSITRGQIAILGIGATLGVAAQALILIPALRKVDYRYRPTRQVRNLGLRKAGTLAAWTIGLVGINQLGFVVVSRLATNANVLATNAGLAAQGLTTYQKAFLIFQLPHAIITVSLVTALYPQMSAAAVRKDWMGFGAKIGAGMRNVAVLIVPAAAGLVAFGPLVAIVVFGIGAGQGDSSFVAGAVVTGFGIGLVPFCLFYVLLRGWYAQEDTRTPFWITVFYNVVMLVLTLSLYSVAPVQAKVLTLALGYSLAYWVTLVFAWWLMRRRVKHLESRQTIKALSKMMLGGAVAGALGFAVMIFIRARTSPGRPVTGLDLSAVVSLAAGGTVLLIAYYLMCRVLGVQELQPMISTLTAKVRPKKSAVE